MIGRVAFVACVACTLAGPALADLATTGAPVAMRAAPSGKAEVVQRIPRSAEIELGKCARGWCQAVWRGRPGYIQAAAVVFGASPATLSGNGMPPPVLNAAPAPVAPPAFRWTGPYVGTNFGFGNGGW